MSNVERPLRGREVAAGKDSSGSKAGAEIPLREPQWPGFAAFGFISHTSCACVLVADRIGGCWYQREAQPGIRPGGRGSF